MQNVELVDIIILGESRLLGQPGECQGRDLGQLLDASQPLFLLARLVCLFKQNREHTYTNREIFTKVCLQDRRAGESSYPLFQGYLTLLKYIELYYPHAPHATSQSTDHRFNALDPSLTLSLTSQY